MMDYLGKRDKKDAEKRKKIKDTGDYKMRMYNSMENAWGEVTEKDDKSGKELNNPTRGDVKKYKVYVKNDKGNVVKVEFGDPNMSIKRDDPEARKAFRARHNCDQKKDKTTAGYWSCKFWSTKSVTDLMKG
jgi:thioredoxin-related protein